MLQFRWRGMGGDQNHHGGARGERRWVHGRRQAGWGAMLHPTTGTSAPAHSPLCSRPGGEVIRGEAVHFERMALLRGEVFALQHFHLILNGKLCAGSGSECARD